MKCAMCNSSFNDGAQCGSCKRHLDFTCANISETAYRKLRSDRRAAWKCPACRNPSPSPSPAPSPESASLEVILNEIRGIKLQLSSLPTLLEDVKTIKTEIADLRASCEFNSAKLDDFSARLTSVESRLPEVVNIRETVTTTQEVLNQVKNDSSAREQWARLNNIEIKGVPQRKGENLFSIVESISKVINYAVPKSQINYVSRIPIHDSKDRSIIVCFINRYIKEEFVAAARALKTISVEDLGFAGTGRVFSYQGWGTSPGQTSYAGYGAAGAGAGPGNYHGWGAPPAPQAPPHAPAWPATNNYTQHTQPPAQGYGSYANYSSAPAGASAGGSWTNWNMPQNSNSTGSGSYVPLSEGGEMYGRGGAGGGAAQPPLSAALSSAALSKSSSADYSTYQQYPPAYQQDQGSSYGGSRYAGEYHAPASQPPGDDYEYTGGSGDGYQRSSKRSYHGATSGGAASASSYHPYRR